MLKEPYTAKSYSYHSKYIKNALALRPPQADSLEIFARLCDVLSLKKNPMTIQQICEEHQAELAACTEDDDRQERISEYASQAAKEFYKDDLAAARQLCPTLTSFERDFPSVCFALATGIGKTRLMGACIAYLHYEKRIRHFFVMAPNLTIYKKLKSDLGDPNNKKYVFQGLDKFVTPPRIVDGDNYEEFRQSSFGSNDIVINVFNIAKLNADSKVKDGKPARIKRLIEVLGKSYFSYLQSLPDLCIFMDESHHYHADKSFEVINELRPILGVELTATPQVQKGAKKILFQNVVYEYSLAHALNDGQYVKVPAVITRKDFHPEEYTPEQLDREKLNDGLRIHEDIKSHLEIYSRTYGKPLVKPFVLVVAKDTVHSRQIKEYLTSNEFFRGDYKGKVLEINSAQRGAEKDENIEQLLSLEQPENKIEIVIHVNMLKEGWDVTNLYTIVPLRTSASETLTEQTIGRGLRLPFGNRTGVPEIDRLSIVSHDKYAAIVNLANDPNSLVRKVYYIDEAAPEAEEPRVTLEMRSSLDEAMQDISFQEQLMMALAQETPATYQSGEQKTEEQNRQVVKFVVNYTAQSVKDLNKQVKTFNAVQDEETRKFLEKTVVSETIRHFSNLDLRPEDVIPVAQKAAETCVQALTDKVIPIPQAVVQPHTTVKQGFYSFKLDTRNMNWHPGDDTLVGTELMESGEKFEWDPNYHAANHVDTPENEIVIRIIKNDDIDYMTTADLLYSLIGDAKEHFLAYLTEDETEKILRDRQKTIAEIIYHQMKEHFFREETAFQAKEMRPFSRIEANFGSKFQSDDIYDLNASLQASEVPKKVFGGFKKACHTLYKFDSNSERILAVVLENDNAVLKWMRPSPKQFNIYYGPGGCSRYEPDFIVETVSQIFMVETKARKELLANDVLEKAKAAQVYCQAASKWNADHDGKPWAYALIPHDEVRINSSFDFLMKNREPLEQLEIAKATGL